MISSTPKAGTTTNPSTSVQLDRSNNSKIASALGAALIAASLAIEGFKVFNDPAQITPFANRFLPSTTTDIYLFTAGCAALVFAQLFFKSNGPSQVSSPATVTPLPKIPANLIDIKSIRKEAPFVRHYESSRPETNAENLFGIKISDTNALLDYLPKELQKIIKKHSATHTGTASVLVVEKTDENWHDIYLHGPLYNTPPSSSSSERTKSWIKTLIGMFSRFGHSETPQSAIDQLTKDRGYNPKAKDPTPVFMKFDEMGKTEQQMAHGGTTGGAHGTSVWISGEKDLEGGLVFCINHPTKGPEDHGYPIWHLSLVLICNRKFSELVKGQTDQIGFLKNQLAQMNDKEAKGALNILDNLDLREQPSSLKKSNNPPQGNKAEVPEKDEDDIEDVLAMIAASEKRDQ